MRKWLVRTRVCGWLRDWARQEDGIAAVEGAYIFPILLLLMLGTYDLGNGILTNYKTIKASQITADLVARLSSVDDTDIDEAITAGELALQPFSTATFGVDIVSIRFGDDVAATPEIVWRETRNMTADADVLGRVAPLAESGEGVVVVVVNYTFEPLFGGFIFDQIDMQEVAFSRGRRTAVVCRDGVDTCG